MNLVLKDIWGVVKVIDRLSIAIAAALLASILLSFDVVSDWAGVSSWRCYRLTIMAVLVWALVVLLKAIGGYVIRMLRNSAGYMMKILNDDCRKVIRTLIVNGKMRMDKEDPSLRFLAKNGYIQIGEWPNRFGEFSCSASHWVEKWAKKNERIVSTYPRPEPTLDELLEADC